MNYYTYVDRENCISCAACGVAAPNLFKYDVEDIAYGCLDNNCGCEPIPFNEIEHLKMHVRVVRRNQSKYHNIHLIKRKCDNDE